MVCSRMHASSIASRKRTGCSESSEGVRRFRTSGCALTLNAQCLIKHAARLAGIRLSACSGTGLSCFERPLRVYVDAGICLPRAGCVHHCWRSTMILRASRHVGTHPPMRGVRESFFQHWKFSGSNQAMLDGGCSKIAMPLWEATALQLSPSSVNFAAVANLREFCW